MAFLLLFSFVLHNLCAALFRYIFWQNCYFAARFGTDLFMVVEKPKEITHVKLLLSLVGKISNICECKHEQIIVYIRD